MGLNLVYRHVNTHATPAMCSTRATSTIQKIVPEKH
jgi:hypothetical protein